MVERDFAELVHQDRGARQGAHQVIQYGGFAAAQEAGQQGDGKRSVFILGAVRLQARSRSIFS